MIDYKPAFKLSLCLTFSLSFYLYLCLLTSQIPSSISLLFSLDEDLRIHTGSACSAHQQCLSQTGDTHLHTYFHSPVLGSDTSVTLHQDSSLWILKIVTKYVKRLCTVLKMMVNDATFKRWNSSMSRMNIFWNNNKNSHSTGCQHTQYWIHDLWNHTHFTPSFEQLKRKVGKLEKAEMEK